MTLFAAQGQWTTLVRAGMAIAACAGGILVSDAHFSSARAQATPEPTPRPASSRIVHRFDFHEPENFFAVPEYWFPFPDGEFPDPAFPRYTEGYFDTAVGHEAPPSFYLESNGRSVAYRYDGPATRVRPGDYLISGWIKPDRVNYARAAISAYYLDWEGEFIAGTQRYSPLVGAAETENAAGNPRGANASNAWQRVEINLPAAPPDAHFVGVTCWVIQQDVWREGMMPHRHISIRDIDGGAWFDDIIVVGLPRAILTSRHPGNVVEQPRTPRLVAVVADEDPHGLSARLLVRDQDGQSMFTSAVAVQSYESEQPVEIELPPLTSGLYTAYLEVFSLDEIILRRRITFAVLGKSHRPRGVVARQMGVIFTSAVPELTADELALVKSLGVGAAKLPIWTGDPARPGFDSARDALHDLLDDMIESRIAVIGTFAGPPASMVRSVGVHARSLLDILSEDPLGWRAELDTIIAPYASIFQSWQVGGDGDQNFIADPRAMAALRAVRGVMADLVTTPNLATVASAAFVPQDVLPQSENLSVELPADIRPNFIREHLAPYQKLDYVQLWASIPLPALREYDRESTLADWALRIIEARWAGVDTVFVPQPWQVRETPNGKVAEPTLPYLVYRTIVDSIGDGVAADRLNLGDAAEALAFADGQEAIVVMWDPTAPPGGAAHTMQLGQADEAIDLFGRPVPLSRDEQGRHVVNLTPTPIFVTGMERWLLGFRAALSLSPDRVDFSVESQTHILAMSNPYDKAISGEIVLNIPENWAINPRRLRFALYPQETRSFELNIRYPQNEPAGTKTIHAAIEMTSRPNYRLDMPLTFELGLSDIDVWGYAVTEGDRLIIRQGVTSRADRPLSFGAFAVFPGRSRQYRVINELLPGQTLTIEYQFNNIKDVAGRKIRLGLREVNGPRMHNLEIMAP